MVVDNFKICPNRNEKNNSSLRTLFAPMVALLVICVAGVPTIYALEDGEKTESEAVAYYQGGGKELSQVSGKWFTDTKSADAYGQKRVNALIQKKSDEGGYLIFNGERRGNSKAIAQAQQQDVDDAHSHENNISEMKSALAEMKRVREMMRKRDEQALREEGLSEEQKIKMRADMANNEKVGAETDDGIREMFQKPLPPPSKTYEPPKVLRSDVTASPVKPTETTTGTAKFETAKPLVSRGENS